MSDGTDESADNLSEQAYHGTGVDMIEVRQDGRVAYNAEYAGYAAGQAFQEARESDIVLEGVEEETFTDEDFVVLCAYADTAAAAAVAYACAELEFRLDSERLRRFWHWWAHEALPEAWFSDVWVR